MEVRLLSPMIQAISETITGSVNLIVKVVCLDGGENFKFRGDFPPTGPEKNTHNL